MDLRIKVPMAVEELQRELAARKQGYPQRVKDNKMTAEEAEKRIACLELSIAIIEAHTLLIEYVDDYLGRIEPEIKEAVTSAATDGK